MFLDLLWEFRGNSSNLGESKYVYVIWGGNGVAGQFRFGITSRRLLFKRDFENFYV